MEGQARREEVGRKGGPNIPGLVGGKSAHLVHEWLQGKAVPDGSGPSGRKTLTYEGVTAREDRPRKTAASKGNLPGVVQLPGRIRRPHLQAVAGSNLVGLGGDVPWPNGEPGGGLRQVDGHDHDHDHSPSCDDSWCLCGHWVFANAVFCVCGMPLGRYHKEDWCCGNVQGAGRCGARSVGATSRK
eukprot:8200946-Heterocapsa_arctica.AAC.1